MKEKETAAYLKEALGDDLIDEIVRQHCVEALDYCDDNMKKALVKVANYCSVPEDQIKKAKKKKPTKIKPIKKLGTNNGIQKIYRFTNNYGASVVRHSRSYGHEKGLWELAVIKFSTPEKWNITYNTPITDNVIGYLNKKQVQAYLQQIEALPGEE